MKRRILQTPSFLRTLKRFLKKQPDKFETIEEILALLETDAFSAQLHTHKLHGRMSEEWSCSAGFDIRIVFKFVKADGEESILLHSIGSHDEVY